MVGQAKENYCVSLRGNGFRVFSHFGALARVVESYGLPAGMSGGSSSVLTMYLTDHLLQNPLIKEDSERAAFLLKIIEPLFYERIKLPEIEIAKHLALQPEAQAKLRKLLAELSQSQGFAALPKIVKMYATEPLFRDFLFLIQSETFKTLVNSQATDNARFSKSLQEKIQEAAKSELGRRLDRSELESLRSLRELQFNQAVMTLQKFSVGEDANFVFREGLLHQKGIADFLEPIARFLSGLDLDSSMMKMYERFLRQCSVHSKGKTWQQIKGQKPGCEKSLKFIARLIFTEQNNFKHWQKSPQMAEHNDFDAKKFNRWRDLSSRSIGESIPMFGMTSLMTGSSALAFEKAQKAYLLSKDPEFGFQYAARVDDLRVGYWGRQPELRRAEHNLNSSGGFVTPNGVRYSFSTDEKSRRFVNLGEISWSDLMHYSSAEPGQSSGRVTTDLNGQKVVTTGGWLDALPAPLLKASGCDHVVAITRNRGDSKFGQEVFARLYPDGGKNISEITDELVMIGIAGETQSIWGKLFNLKNPQSSVNQSLLATDVVVCSFWDDIPQNSSPEQFFSLGYHAKASFENSRMGAAEKLWQGEIIRRSDNLPTMKNGGKLYSGCLIDAF
ncbi:MAG: hypothetical protein ACK5P6_09630 [Pseudobdellovibrionaceae bacterium]